MNQTENNDKMKINLNRKASKKLSWLNNSQFGKNYENNHFLNRKSINFVLVFMICNKFVNEREQMMNLKKENNQPLFNKNYFDNFYHISE
jgi:hypothetical protein